ncbi:MAG: hypothetical protein KDJ90_04040 [Nitratireductor sp.]|nr:hypothetical protein [Nitratireductor sp.]
MGDETREPFEVDRAVLITAGLAVANDRVVEALVKVLQAKGILTAEELAAQLEEPEFLAETSGQSAAFYKGIKKA